MEENFSRLPRKIVNGYDPSKDPTIREVVLTKYLEILLGLPSSAHAVYPGKNLKYEKMVKEIDQICEGKSSNYSKPEVALTLERLPSYLSLLDRTIVPLAISSGFVSVEDKLRYYSRRDKIRKKYSQRNKRRLEEWVNDLYTKVSSSVQDSISSKSCKLSTTN